MREARERASSISAGDMGPGGSRSANEQSQAAFNFKAGYSKRLSNMRIREVIRDLIRGCGTRHAFPAPFSCGQEKRIRPEYPLTAKGPEHETMAFWAPIAVSGTWRTFAAPMISATSLGMDTITAGAMISCAMGAL